MSHERCCELRVLCVQRSVLHTGLAIQLIAAAAAAGLCTFPLLVVLWSVLVSCIACGMWDVECGDTTLVHSHSIGVH